VQTVKAHAGARRRDAPRGRDLQGRCIAPGPIAGGRKPRTKLPGAILDSTCAGPEGVSPRDGANNPRSGDFHCREPG
jgi:hypothetical protein